MTKCCTSKNSPKTGLTLTHKTLTPNYVVKACVDEAVQGKLKEMAGEGEADAKLIRWQ